MQKHHETKKIREKNLMKVHFLDAWDWCTGMIQRDDMGWKVGGGVQDWELMYTHGGFMSMYGKTNIVL